MRLVGLGVGLLGVLGATPAWAFPCTVEGGKTVEQCIDEVGDGEEVLLPANARIEVNGLVLLRKSVQIRSVSPDFPATLVHRVSAPGTPSSSSPVPDGAMFGVPSGLSLSIVDARVELVDNGGITTSRLALVDGELTLRGVTLEGVSGYPAGGPSNQAGGYLVYAQGSGQVFLDDVFVGNIEASSHLGGAVYAVGDARVEIYGTSTFETCKAWKGGAVHARFGASVHVRDTEDGSEGPAPVFENNRAQAFGGAIMVEGSGGELRVSGGTFLRSVSVDKGAHLATLGGADMTVDGGVFEGGQATYGAGLYANGGLVNVSGAAFRDNVATADGGAIDLYQVDGGSVRHVRFDDNQAAQGGAIYVLEPRGRVEVEQDRFCGNLGTTSGAELHAAGGTQVLTFKNNLVDGGGAAGAAALSLLNQVYEVDQNTFVRLPAAAVAIDGGAGSLSRNAFGWIGDNAAVEITDTGAVPEPLRANTFHDADGDWTDAILVASASYGPGTEGTLAPLGLTGERGDGLLGERCDIVRHHLRPDSALLDAPWDDPDIRLSVRGFLGGATPFSIPGKRDPWTDDRDQDSVIAIWDCDDQDAALGRLCDGASVDPQDSDVYWYGACSAIQAPWTTPWLLGLGGLLVWRRRRRA